MPKNRSRSPKSAQSSLLQGRPTRAFFSGKRGESEDVWNHQITARTQDRHPRGKITETIASRYARGGVVHTLVVNDADIAIGLTVAGLRNPQMIDEQTGGSILDRLGVGQARCQPTYTRRTQTRSKTSRLTPLPV